MGKAIKKERKHQAYLRLREMNSNGKTTMKTITMKNGAEVCINPTKRFLFQKPYKNPEFEKEMLRLVGRSALGEKKYKELEDMAAKGGRK